MGLGKSTFAFTTTAITLDGGSTTINITRDNQSYSHKLSHGYGDIATLAVGTTSYAWKPTAAQLTKFFQEVPNQKTRQIDVYLDTYNGSTLVGRDVHAVTVTLSEATGKPTLSGFAINDGNATTKGWGILVYGKSTITASQSVSAKHGASIVKTVYTYEGSEYTSIASLIGSLPLTTTPTNYTIGCKTVDSRGFTTTASLTKSCAKYEAPTINSFEVIRCDTDGYENDNGTKAKAIVKGSWAYIGGKNAATFKIGYKLKNAESYTYLTISVTKGTIDYSTLLNPTFVADYDYLFAVSLTDSISGSFNDSGIDFSNGINILSVSADNSVVDINSDSVLNLNAVDQINLGAHGIHLKTSEGTMLFESEVAAQGDMPGSIVFKGQNVYDTIRFTNAQVTQDIPVLLEADCNYLIETGKYYLGNGGTNRPVNVNGWLESKLYSTDYCHQVYTTYQGQTYERTMQAGTWGSWRRNYAGVILFSNPSQALSGAITLADTAANYTILDIFFKTSDNYYGNTRVYSPNGKVVSLTAGNVWASGVGIKIKDVLINGKIINANKLSNSAYATGQFAIDSGSGSTFNAQKDYIAITQVIGWE